MKRKSCVLSKHLDMYKPGLTLHSDKTTLNPLLIPGDSATLRVVDGNGQPIDISRVETRFSVSTVAASGEAEVARLSGDRIIGLEGGVAEVTASVLLNGQTFKARRRFVVRPFYREYHKTLVLKLFLGQEKHPNPAWGQRVSFEQALEVIRKVDALTLGIPKIVYLVGWQTGGHDWGYPDWGPVDPQLKRSQDATALDSLQWLMRTAREYHTTVSLHINMFDAYQSSPLWDEYIARDVIARGRSGELFLRGERYHEETVYCVCYTREWQEGLAQRRIDRLLEMLPELVEGHTIHIDAFHTAWKGYLASTWHSMKGHGGVTLDSEVETQRKIFSYFRARGIDVTCEGMQSDFIGLQPMIWWFHKNFRWQMKVPERLCARGRTTHTSRPDFHFGSSMHGEEIFVQDKEILPGFLDQFCLTTLPWFYLSQLERVHLSVFGKLTYSEGVTAGWENFQSVIRQGNVILRRGDDLFVPALWCKEKTIIAYSRKGYPNREWVLPEDWSGVEQVNVNKISLSGLIPLENGPKVTGDKIHLSLEPRQAVVITPR
jgi:hypothetical protein